MEKYKETENTYEVTRHGRQLHVIGVPRGENWENLGINMTEMWGLTSAKEINENKSIVRSSSE